MTPILLVSLLLSNPSPAPSSLKAADGVYRCEVAVVRVAAPDPRLRWGGGAEARTRVSKLTIKAGKVSVYAAASAWSDLGDPRSVEIVASKGGCLVYIDGGDASEGYTATLRVRGEHVVERVVRSSEFPKEHYEKTTYGFDAPPEGYRLGASLEPGSA